MNKEQAVKASRIGALAAFGAAGLATVVFLFASFSNVTEGILSLFNDPTIVLDIGLAVICGFALLRQSRAAAVTIFAWYLISKVMQLILYPSTFAGLGLVISLFFLYFFARAIQGTFNFHRLEKDQNPDYRPSSKWAYILGIPAGLIGLAVVIFGLLTMTNILPSTKVVGGHQVSASDKVLLVENNIIAPNERIEYFYSEGFLSIKEGGSILTDERVIVYWQKDDGAIERGWLPFGQIASIELTEEGNYLNDSIYRVTSFDNGYWLDLYLSFEDRGDIKFVNALRKKVGN